MSEKPPFDPNKPFQSGAEPSQEAVQSSSNEKPAFDPNQPFSVASDQYGTLGQQAKTVLEQGLSGATLGVSKGIETQFLGVKPEDIEGREKANPGLALTSNIGGTIGSFALTGGAGGLLGKGAGVAARVGAGALEGAAIGGVNQLTDDWSKNHPLDAQKIASSAGIGALLGGALTGVAEGLKYMFGTPLAKGAAEGAEKEALEAAAERPPVISELDAPGYQSGDFKSGVENSGVVPEKEVPSVLEGIKDTKPEAKEIAKAAETIGAPVLEGMVSSSRWVQKAEDALINGAPTYPGIQRQKLYQEVYGAVKNSVDNALGEGSAYTKAELGNTLKKSITGQIEKTLKPIQDLYSQIKQIYPTIPLSEKSAPAIARSLSQLQEFRVSPSSPEGALVKRVIKEIRNLKTVDDVKVYKTILGRSVSPTASSGERRMAGIIADKLSNLEERSIVRFAKTQGDNPEVQKTLLGLIEQRGAADAAYKPFRQNLNTLAEQLGKGRISGPEDAIHFINERLTPEEIVSKLFSKKDAEFLKFFSKNFPEEMNLMRDYQKGILREGASQSGELSPALALKKVLSLEPEIQRSLFSPEQLNSLKSAQIVHKSIPKSFNPSGTAHTSAFREFFTHPTGALVGNVRDAAISQFIRSSKVIENTSQALQKQVLKTNTRINRGIDAIFSHEDKK